MRYSVAFIKARIAKLEMELIHHPPISETVREETEKVILDLKVDCTIIEQYYNANKDN